MRGKITPDPKILVALQRRLASAGLRPPTRVDVRVHNGDVTLSGTIQYEHQRQSALQAARGVEGIKRVTDQLQLKAAVKRT